MSLTQQQKQNPLTTTFTPPSSCVASTAAYEIRSDGTKLFHLIGPRAPSTECFPSGYTSTINSGIFSPGVCPDQYTPACKRQTSSVGTVTETRDICCPDVHDFTCGPTVAANFEGPWQSAFGCIRRYDKEMTLPLLKTVTIGDDAATTTETNSRVVLTPKGTNTIYAFSVQVAWQTSDHMTPPPTSTNDEPGPDNGGDGGLGKGAQIGLGVGLGTLFVLLLAGVFLYFRRRRQRQLGRYARVDPGAYTPNPSPSPGLVKISPGTTPGTMLHVAVGHEMGAPLRPAELPPDSQVSSAHRRQTPVAEVLGDTVQPGSEYRG